VCALISKKVNRVEGKNGRPYEEIQLDFAFVSEGGESSPASSGEGGLPARTSRFVRPRRFANVLTTAQSTLLDAPLEELNSHLLPLFEFCEAALTRTLDVVPLRKGELFSTEEYRSLRGVGQAQWLLNEVQNRRKMKIMEGKSKKKKKSMNDEC
jgi:hypothetical protein